MPPGDLPDSQVVEVDVKGSESGHLTNHPPGSHALVRVHVLKHPEDSYPTYLNTLDTYCIPFKSLLHLFAYAYILILIAQICAVYGVSKGGLTDIRF